MKAILVTFALVLLCSSVAHADATADLTTFLKGLFSNTPDANTNVDEAVKCFTPTTVNAAITAINALLDQAALCNPNDLGTFAGKVNAILAAIPADELTCVKQTQAAQTLVRDFGLVGVTKDQFEAAVKAFIDARLPEACTRVQQFNQMVQVGNMFAFGAGAGKLLNQVFNTIAFRFANFAAADSVNALVNFLKGLFSVTSHANIDISINCFTPATADAAITAINALLDQAALCNPNDLGTFAGKVNAILAAIPANELACAKQTPIAQALINDFGLVGVTKDQFEAAVKAFIDAHLPEACTRVQQFNQMVQVGNLFAFGAGAGQLLKEAFHTAALRFFSFAAADNVADFTTILNGLASVTKDAGIDVAPLVACVDANTAATLKDNLVALIGEGSKCDPAVIPDVAAKIDALLHSIPADQIQCVRDNNVAKALLADFGVAGLGVDGVKQKVVAYIMGHILTVCTNLQNLNKHISSENWFQFGVDGGHELQRIFLGATRFAFRGAAIRF